MWPEMCEKWLERKPEEHLVTITASVWRSSLMRPTITTLNMPYPTDDDSTQWNSLQQALRNN